MVKAFVDASYDDKRDVCGIGIVIQEGVKQRTISSYIPTDNINYGELFAIYIASILLNGKKDATIYTDSSTAMYYLKGDIKDKPRTHTQYIRHQQMRVLAYKVNRLHIPVEKVKGHTKNFKENAIGNELADVLAKQGRSKFYLTSR